MKPHRVQISGLLLGVTAIIIFQAQIQLPSETDEQVKQWKQEHGERLNEQRSVEKQKTLIVKKERGILQKLQRIESELAANQKDLAQYRKEIGHHQLEAKTLQIELRALRSQDKQYKKLVAKRIRAIYKIGYQEHHLHTLKILFRAQNIIDLLQRYKYMSVVTEADQNMLDLLHTQQNEILQTHLELARRIQTVETATRSAQAKRARILAQKQEREQVLHQYRTQKEIYDQTLRELRVAVAQLEDLLGIVSEELVAEKAEAIRSIRVDLQGGLPWPVVGKVVLNQTAIDRGLTIQAEKGSPVRCIADGIVARTVESIVGYGNTILVMHGEGYISVYAHLSEILVMRGDIIRVQQVIGNVGDTGSLIGEVLYFELWHNYNRLNTQEWLAQ